MTPPLKPAVFHILLALSDGTRHGLGIADEIEVATDGAIRLGPGTLYRSLDEMHERGLVRRSDPPVEDSDPRRKYYAITAPGRDLLRQEVGRFERIVEAARARGVAGGA